MHLRSKLHSETNGFGLQGGHPGLLCIGIVLTLLSVAQTCTAQSAPVPVLVPHEMLRGNFAEWPKIRLDIGFFGGKSTPVIGPAKGEMLVVEDGVQQADAVLQQAQGPASICLLVDQSSSMKKNGIALVGAAKQLIANASPADEIAILAFDKTVYLEQDFTGDREKLESGLQRVGFGGPSVFFDAVWVAIDQLATRAPERRKILVILSDGDDNYSRVQFGDLRHKGPVSGDSINLLAQSSCGAK